MGPTGLVGPDSCTVSLHVSRTLIRPWNMEIICDMFGSNRIILGQKYAKHYM